MAAIPFLPGVGFPELLLILLVVLLLFGPKRLPQLGKSLGKTVRSIREGVEGKFDEENEDDSESSKSEAKKAESESKDSSEED